MAPVIRWCVGLLSVLVTVGWTTSGLSHQASEGVSLRKIGPAPAFSLTTQDGVQLSLQALRGKVAVITFIYTSCADTCPLLTVKLAQLQARLGPDFGPKVFFVSITVDPEQDTPEVLKRYAKGHGANLDGWAFLTGTSAEIRDVAKHYGIAYRKIHGGDIDHTFLTSIVDQSGILRVQYMGVRFDPDEFLQDLRQLLREERPR